MFKSLACNRPGSMKLDFGTLIATLWMVLHRFPPIATSSPRRMALSFSEMIEEARLSARALLDYGDHFFNPTVRLGVTGLCLARKSVFITALIHGLHRRGRA